MCTYNRGIVSWDFFSRGVEKLKGATKSILLSYYRGTRQGEKQPLGLFALQMRRFVTYLHYYYIHNKDTRHSPRTKMDMCIYIYIYSRFIFYQILIRHGRVTYS